MAKEERNYSKAFRKQSVLLYIVMIISLFSCIFGMVNACNYQKDTVASSEYDVSAFKSLSLEEANKLVNESGISVIYIGREGCESCVNMLPVIKEAQIEKNFITKYIDIANVDESSILWQELLEKFDLKVSINVQGEQINDTYGNLLNSKGVTPCFIIMKDGKQIAGNIGEMDLNDYTDWLAASGL